MTFNVRSWDETNKQVVTKETTLNATVLEGNNPDEWIGLGNGYYMVKGEVTYKVLNILGDDVHLILTDNCQLNCKHIKLEGTNKLHIHSQSDDEKQGKLRAKTLPPSVNINRDQHYIVMPLSLEVAETKAMAVRSKSTVETSWLQPLEVNKKVVESEAVARAKEVTGIRTTDCTDKDDAWYDLSGRKLNVKPAKKGIYINRGKKILIK